MARRLRRASNRAAFDDTRTLRLVARVTTVRKKMRRPDRIDLLGVGEFTEVANVPLTSLLIACPLLIDTLIAFQISRKSSKQGGYKSD